MNSFILLVAILTCSSSCPIGVPSGCPDIHNISAYTIQTETLGQLELAVNISTTGHTFRPEAVKPALYTENMMSSRITSGGCEGFYNFTSSDIAVNTACPWYYDCDYDAQRIPAVMFHARCRSDVPVPGTGPGYCKEVYSMFSYLTTESCDPLEDNANSTEWKLQSKVVPVTCNLISNL